MSRPSSKHTQCVARTWSVVVKETFMITGRSLVAVGEYQGDIHQGDAATVHIGDSVILVNQIYWDFPRMQGPQLIAIILPGLTKEQVPAGAVLRYHDAAATTPGGARRAR